jgi:hypothetical protein
MPRGSIGIGDLECRGESLKHLVQLLPLDRILDGNSDSQLGAGNALRPWQVEDFALIFQEVELSRPVATHDEGVHVVLCNVGPLLSPAGFWKYRIHTAQRADNLNSLREVDEGLFAFDTIELVGRDTHYKAMAQCPCPLEKMEMADVKQVKSAVSEDDFGQIISPVTRTQP